MHLGKMDGKSMRRSTVLAALFVITLTIAFIGAAGAITEKTEADNRIQQIKNIISDKYQIVSAKFNSPEVIINTYTVNEFLQKAQDVNATMVYKTELDGYVVVDQDFKFAYSFQYDPYTNTNMVYYLTMGIIGLLVMVILMMIHISSIQHNCKHSSVNQK